MKHMGVEHVCVCVCGRVYVYGRVCDCVRVFMCKFCPTVPCSSCAPTCGCLCVCV